MRAPLSPWGGIGALTLAATGQMMAMACSAGALSAKQISGLYAGTPPAWAADRLTRDLMMLGDAWVDATAMVGGRS